VHLVGGCPHLEPDPVGAIDALIYVADAERPIVVHVDETLDP